MGCRSVSKNPNNALPREWTGVDSQGVTWRGFFENGEITSLFPEQCIITVEVYNEERIQNK